MSLSSAARRIYNYGFKELRLAGGLVKRAINKPIDAYIEKEKKIDAYRRNRDNAMIEANRKRAGY